MGDIFDLWIADRRYFVDRYPTVIAKMRKLIAAGIHIHYFEGNHDLDLRPFWQHKLGVDVQSEAAFFEVGTFKLRVEHGDQMDPTDKGYLFLRWLLRTVVVVWLGRHLPNWLVAKIGVRASHGSRAYTTQVKTASDDEARKKIRAHAHKMYAEKPFDILVSGHVHAREDFSLADYRCVNMGTWLKEPLVFEIKGDVAVLKSVEDFLRL